MRICFIQHYDSLMYYEGKNNWSKTLNNKCFYTPRAAKWQKKFLNTNYGYPLDFIKIYIGDVVNIKEI